MVTDWLKSGWQTYKEHYKQLIGGSIILFSISGLSYVDQLIPRLTNLVWLVEIVIGSLTAAGWSIFCLNLVRGTQTQIGTIFSGFKKIKVVLIVSFFYYAIMFGGMMLLIIPGVIWSIKYGFNLYLVMERGLLPRESLRVSAEITKGHKGKLFALFVILSLLYIPVMVPLTIFANRSYYEVSGWILFPLWLVTWVPMILVLTPLTGATFAAAYEQLSQLRDESSYLQAEQPIGRT